MAFRMQASVHGLMDTSDEAQAIQDLYGTKGTMERSRKLPAGRRLANCGCRFIQLPPPWLGLMVM